MPQLPAGSVDARLLDELSLAKNPEMRSQDVPENIARTSCNGESLATWPCKPY
ncbi:MAG: hypothetical protein KKH12_10160 [Gammaproteobacteria bacterium]|nr:hypothetical protein [Gammaproteobacteria bacterium]MBU1482024.1 hypothetical protein [Gammaproteobacteria bacterium]